MTPVGLAPIIPYAGTVAGGGLTLLGADFGFGTAQSLAVAGVDLLAFASSRAATLSNLVITVLAYVSIGNSTAQIYTSVNGGVTWVATPIVVTITGAGTFTDTTHTAVIAPDTLVALRVTPAIVGATITLSAGLQYN